MAKSEEPQAPPAPRGKHTGLYVAIIVVVAFLAFGAYEKRGLSGMHGDPTDWSKYQSER